MKKIKAILLALLSISSISLVAQKNCTTFESIYALISQKDFFKATEQYELQKTNLTHVHQYIIEAHLLNAFNQIESSNQKINWLIHSKTKLADSLVYKLYKIKEDNAVKRYDYKEAKKSIEYIIQNYGHLISEDIRKNAENNLTIWTVLVNQPAQLVKIKEQTRLKMNKDKAGLNNLTICTEKDSSNFIFDTGANISTVTETTAKILGMKLIPASIQVGTITGEDVYANLAICPMLKLGSIEIRNSIFLVLKDDALKFAEINYQINGILGYPIIEALKQVQTTRDGHFIVLKDTIKETLLPNLAMDELTPLIVLNNRLFTLDTGADSTLLYSPYYLENQQEIVANNTVSIVNLGGAAGVRAFKAYKKDLRIAVNDKIFELKNVSILPTYFDENRNSIYGNIGQDLIQQFESMTLNFINMSIKFD